MKLFLFNNDIVHSIYFCLQVTEEDISKVTRELDFSDTFKNSVIIIDEIPRLSSGKINKRLLRQNAEKLFKPEKQSFLIT